MRPIVHLETRIEGTKQTWNALRFACETADMATSVTMMKAAGIKLICKTLQMSYDTNRIRHDLPLFVINDPTSYVEEQATGPFEHKNIKVR